MAFRKLVVLVATAFLALSGCSKEQWWEGGVYSVEAEGGGFSIVKILKLHPAGVHIRLYSNHFSQRPTEIDVPALYMAGLTRKPGEQLGMGHLPLSHTSFSAWRPKLIKIVSVESTELEGYEVWRQAKGGYL
jgi:hypothetical protein